MSDTLLPDTLQFDAPWTDALQSDAPWPDVLARRSPALRATTRYSPALRALTRRMPSGLVMYCGPASARAAPLAAPPSGRDGPGRLTVTPSR